MTTAEHFKATLAARRAHGRGTPEHKYLTRAARTLAMMLRGIPASEWVQ